jgi:hypothetical protein
MNGYSKFFGAAVAVFCVVTFQGASAKADNCAGDFCVGMRVIDNNELIGTVVAVGPTAITYSIPGYSSETASPSQLSPEIDGIGAIKPGAEVMDNNELIGKVDHVFKNAKTQYTIPGYSASIGSASNLATEVRTVSGYADIFEGVTVMDNNQLIGTVKKVFSNGKVQYLIPGYSASITNVANLSAMVSGIGQLAVGVTVMDNNELIGTVTELFANGEVQYLIPGYSASITQASNLSIKVDSIGALHAGVTIIDNNELIGAVKQLFANRKVQYLIPGYSASITSASNLAIQVDSLPESPGIKKDVLVVDNNDLVGTVKMIFVNHKVQYTVPGYSASITNASNLSPEVSTNASYQKGVDYATGSYAVGNISHFFADGRMQVSYIRGGSGVERKLYSEVPSINGVSAGSSITNANEVVGSVTKTFANGTLAYTYQPAPSRFNPHPDAVKASTKLLGADAGDAQLKQDEELWIRELASFMACVQDEHGDTSQCISWGGSSIATVTSNYAALKQTLLALLQQKPGILPDAAIRAKVIAELQAH